MRYGALDVDALPPPTHESRPAQAIADRAGSPEKPPERRLYLEAQLGFGVGVSNWGLASMTLAEGELWLLPFLGLGLEGERASSSAVVVFEPRDREHFRALRGRLAFRFPGTRGHAVGALAVGRAGITTEDEYYLSPAELEASCDESYEPCDRGFSFMDPTGLHTRHEDEYTVAFEFGYRAEWHFLDGGAFARLEVVPPVVLIMGGLSCGFAF